MSTVVEQQKMEEETTQQVVPEVDEEALKVRGKPKSGRGWKEPVGREQTHRVKPKALRKSWKVKQEERQRLEERKELLAQVKQVQAQEKLAAKEERRRRIMIREENLIKGSAYQVVTNTERIKKMSKKQRKGLMPMQDLKKLNEKTRK
eukprot:TRINITY_DN1418_c0_g1_i2.p1 TRINITY_DN1418_c0_g1~~TRINITY_DN1418_c0_g1_i2.p1  ORF type:complete len:148 (+),score=53.77 TRINITY_DN1418_c0_g1_i2:106-549(+)